MKHIIIVCLVLFTLHSMAQVPDFKQVRIVSYNVENLFDCVDDSLTNDAEYLGGGIRGWNYERYKTKLEHISKVIVNIGEWENPAIIGLCEIESEKCMRDLTRYSGLQNLHYKYIHYESPDPRGVDVAMLYQPEVFQPIQSKAVHVKFKSQPNATTRDILYVEGKLYHSDTLHIYVCHFPSRLGGELESEDKRIQAAETLRQHTDSIFKTNPDARIIIMGDFNDYPTDKSIKQTLNAQNPLNNLKFKLFNLAYPLQEKGYGSHKHNGEWGMLDQIIVSESLLNGTKLSCKEVNVYRAGFLLENDTNFLGEKPFRTYNGMQYQGGYADHLPVYTDIIIKQNATQR